MSTGQSEIGPVVSDVDHMEACGSPQHLEDSLCWICGQGEGSNEANTFYPVRVEGEGTYRVNICDTCWEQRQKREKLREAGVLDGVAEQVANREVKTLQSKRNQSRTISDTTDRTDNALATPTKTVLLNDLIEIASTAGRPPTKKDISIHSNYPPLLFKNRFGSIDEALSAAGLH